MIVGALVFAMAAAGVLLWSDFLGVGVFRQATPEERLVSEMEAVASAGGFAASFSDQDARRWQLADGHRFERLAVDSSRSAIGRLSSSVPLDVSPPSWESQGLSIELPASLAQQWNGQRIEIGIIARAGQTNGSNVLKAVFATRQAGNSGWRGFELNGEFKINRILFDMPVVETGYTAKPIVVLHSDEKGTGRSVEILGLYVRQVPRTS